METGGCDQRQRHHSLDQGLSVLGKGGVYEEAESTCGILEPEVSAGNGRSWRVRSGEVGKLDS